MQPKNLDKGALTETKFKEWLNYKKIPFWYIQQDIETFSQGLKQHNSKRPDFIILIPNIGSILVDVEYKKLLEKHGKFPINIEEANTYLNLQKYFNMPVWFAFSHENYNFKTWFWIPITEVIQTAIYQSKKDNEEKYYAVDIDKFKQLSYEDSINRLFSFTKGENK
jgi:hypothetical protein|tara:strand:+ start:427 stop:924 length:498 start_codon:yes stop_codon:yes gene_type:complete